MVETQFIASVFIASVFIALFKYSTGLGISFLPIVFREAGDSDSLGGRGVYELDLVAGTYHDTYMADTVALAGSLKKKQIAYLSLT